MVLLSGVMEVVSWWRRLRMRIAGENELEVLQVGRWWSMMVVVNR